MPRRKSNKRPFTFTVDQRPTVKGRPRLGRRGRVFTPARTLEAEAYIAALYEKLRGPFYDGPVMIEAVFRTSETEVTISPLEEAHTSKLRGDTDNYLKLLLDGLNGVAFIDDKCVMIVRGEKR